MNQRAQGPIEDDRQTVVFRTESSRRPLLAALPVVAILAAVVFLGVTGGHEAGDRPWTHQLTPPPAPSGVALVAGASASASMPAETPTPYRPMPIPTSAVPGYAQIRPRASDVLQIPIGETAWPLASDGRAVLYADGQALYRIDMANPAAETVAIAQAGPCGFIVDAAVSGNEIAYVEVQPAPVSPDAAGGCPPWGARMTWRIVLVNTKTGEQLAGVSGEMDTPLEISAYQISSLYRSAVTKSPTAIPHVAVSPDAYAFSYSTTHGIESTLQVRSLVDNSIQSTRAVPGVVTQILMGGTRVVVVGHEVEFQTMLGARTVYSADTWTLPFVSLGLTTGLASLSPDGQRLTFPGCDGSGRCGDLTIAESGFMTELASPFPSGATATADGTAIAWAPQAGYETLDSVPCFLVRDSRFPDGAAIVTAAPVAWIAYDGDFLIWAELSGDNTVTLYSMDIGIVAVYQP